MLIIEKNCRRGVVVVSDSNKVLGVLTDGDIRKALIRGRIMNSYIRDFINLSFKSIEYKDDEYIYKKANEIFDKHKEIEIIPILTRNLQLKSIAIRR